MRVEANVETEECSQEVRLLVPRARCFEKMHGRETDYDKRAGCGDSRGRLSPHRPYPHFLNCGSIST